MAHMMLSEKRATRGKRMGELVGQAAEDDDMFWNHDTWQEGEGSDEESFQEEDEPLKPDEFDSDFGESESEEDEEEGEEEERRAVKEGKEKSTKKNRYNEPVPARKKPKQSILRPIVTFKDDLDGRESGDEMDVVTSDDREASSSSVAPKIPVPRRKKPIDTSNEEKRIVRDSTKVKTVTADIERSQRDEEQRRKSRPSARVRKSHFTLEELLKEAVDTEEENQRWLRNRKFLLQQKEAEEERHSAAANKPIVHRDYIRYFSRRNVGTYVTFSSVEAIPSILRPEMQQPPKPPPQTCVITGRPARYRDPVTGLPYADIAAFKELRSRHAKGQLNRVTSSSSISNKVNIPSNGNTNGMDIGSSSSSSRLTQAQQVGSATTNIIDLSTAAPVVDSQHTSSESSIILSLSISKHPAGRIKSKLSATLTANAYSQELDDSDAMDTS